MFTPRPPLITRTAPVRRLGVCCLIGLSAGFACRAQDAPQSRDQSSSSASRDAAQNAHSEDKAVLDPGCPHQDGQACGHEPGELASQEGKNKWFGAQFNPTDAAYVSLDQVLSHPQEFHDQQVIVSGQVRRACSRRGCWMEITPSSGDGKASCRVTFKDYGFLVPTDAAGSQARLLGKVQVTVIPSSAVQHYESEGATFANKRADGSALEVRIVASGVELSRES